MIRLALMLVMALSSLAHAHGIEIPSWLPRHTVTITHAIPIPTRGPTPQGVREQTVRGMLYRPAREGRIPGAVIVNSSGGVDGESELVWAVYLAELGIATLVVDSFEPRGVRRTSTDQSQLDQHWSSHDGAAGFRWLHAQSFIAPDNILILGMSRGGNAALDNALNQQRAELRVEDTRFAAHIAISPWCNLQERNAASTGAPIFLMLGELDDYTPIQPCLEYSERMRLAGNPNVRRAVYAGAFHAPELSWGSAVLPDAQAWTRCVVFREDGGRSFTPAGSSTSIPRAEIRAWQLANCVQYGPSVGGDMRLRQQMGADLLRFLLQYGFVRDRPMLAALPPCDAIPETYGLRRSCQRAAWGWPAEAGILSWNLRQGSRTLPNDPTRSLALARLAAERGRADSQTNLATWLREGSNGATRDLAAARVWATRADAQGNGGAANELGLLAEIDRDLPAARRHFRRAAERYNSWGMWHYGRFLAGGLGGPADPAAAERWMRLAIHYENPWGHIALARALEAGQLGRPGDRAAALAEYRLAAAREFEGREEARRQVTRLEAAPRPAR